MIHDDQLDGLLQSFHRDPATHRDLESVVQRVLATAIEEAPRRRGFSLRPGRWRFGPMLNATRFVAASVIVALFGSFLLAGVLTRTGDQRSPAVGASASARTEPTEMTTADQVRQTRSDVLSGVNLVVEEVEPGAYRVLKDGVRDLTRLVPSEDAGDPSDRLVAYSNRLKSLTNGRLVAGLDGSVWSIGPDGFFRLGDATSHDWTGLKPPTPDEDIEVGPDGTIWWADRPDPHAALRSFDGETWSDRRNTTPGLRVGDVEITSDGTVWVTWSSDDGRSRIWRLDGDGWQIIDGPDADPYESRLSVAAERNDGVWAMPYRLQHLGDDGWRDVATPEGGEMAFDVGPDGTVWVRLHPDCGPGTRGNTRNDDCAGPSSVLARFDGTDWERYDATDGLPPMGGFHIFPADGFEVSPDGHIWFTPYAADFHEGSDPADWCDGIADFDGEQVRYHLRDHCIYGMDIAPDGDVWLLAGPRGPVSSTTPDTVDTYVITSESVVVTE